MGCVEDGCDRLVKIKARQLCAMHYLRLQRAHGVGNLPPHGQEVRRHEPLEERFFRMVRWPSNWSACWPCGISIDRHGYGRISVDGRLTGAHRVAYEMAIGPIPDGLVIDHLCRNPPCVNPMHLEPVTQAENMHRSAGRSHRPPNRSRPLKTHCSQGHPYDETNTRLWRGGRFCRACNRDAARRSAARRRTGL